MRQPRVRVSVGGGGGVGMGQVGVVMTGAGGTLETNVDGAATV